MNAISLMKIKGLQVNDNAKLSTRRLIRVSCVYPIAEIYTKTFVFLKKLVYL